MQIIGSWDDARGSAFVAVVPAFQIWATLAVADVSIVVQVPGRRSFLCGVGPPTGTLCGCMFCLYAASAAVRTVQSACPSQLKDSVFL